MTKVEKEKLLEIKSLIGGAWTKINTITAEGLVKYEVSAPIKSRLAEAFHKLEALLI